MIYVDGLCFIRDNPEDIRDSGLHAFIHDVSAIEMGQNPDGTPWARRTFEKCLQSIVAMRRRLRGDLAPYAFLATRGSDIERAIRSGKTAIFLQFQGCEPIASDLSRIDLFYELGLRVLQITHHHDNPIGGGALEPRPSGLTRLGFDAIARMNELGVIPDLSHASDPTCMDVLATSKKPVIVSHGAARALVNHPRCIPDEAIRGIADSGGVVGIFMMSFWLTSDPVPRIDHLIAQIRHIIRVGGIDAVGIANDYPLRGEPGLAELGNDNARGVLNYHPWWKSMQERGIWGFETLPKHVVIPELNHVRRMFTIHQALDQAGFKPDEVEKILGGNWVRVLHTLA